MPDSMMEEEVGGSPMLINEPPMMPADTPMMAEPPMDPAMVEATPRMRVVYYHPTHHHYYPSHPAMSDDGANMDGEEDGNGGAAGRVYPPYIAHNYFPYYWRPDQYPARYFG